MNDRLDLARDVEVPDVRLDLLWRGDLRCAWHVGEALVPLQDLRCVLGFKGVLIAPAPELARCVDDVTVQTLVWTRAMTARPRPPVSQGMTRARSAPAPSR